MQRLSIATFLTVICIAGNKPRSFVETAPVDNVEAAASSDRQHHFELPSGERLNDEAVRELRNLKTDLPADSAGGNGNSISVVKTHSAVFTNLNGKQEGHAEMKEQVNKNGEMFAKVEQKVDAKEDPKLGSPSTHVLTEVDIPSKGIHRVFSSDPNEKPSVGTKTTSKRRSYSAAPARGYEGNDMVVDLFSKAPVNMQYSPLDMAEYVFWTGDEKGVTMAVEEFLKQGLMTREEAINFLQDIKYNLDYLQVHYNDNKLKNEDRSREKSRQLQKIFGQAERSRDSDLREIRQQLRQNYEKKADYMGMTEPHMRSSMSTDDDYEELLEKLKVADYLYSEYSIEDVLYQLAKVMFTQTLRRGSSEAQEALQKFTDFLESEAEQGKITRTLERKVLDVLVASLTDTLAEHPELISAAREGFGKENLQDSPSFSRQAYFSRHENDNSIKTNEKSSQPALKYHLNKNVHDTRPILSEPALQDMVMKKRNIHSSGIEDGENV